MFFINDVIGGKRRNIVVIILIQMILGVSNVFYAFILRNGIDSAVNHDKTVMISALFLLIVLVTIQIGMRAAVRYLEELSKK